MKFVFLGSGSAFTVGADNFHSNMLLISDRGKSFLIDCGSDIRFSLLLAGFSHTDISDIYISHLHTDHAGGLEFIGLNTKFDPTCDRPNLYLSKDLAGDLWERTLSGGMRSVEGDILDLESYFKVHKIDRNSYFEWEGIQFNLVKVTHVNNGYFIIPSYGLFFEVEGVKVFLTTDARLTLEDNATFYEQADLIFHDCETSPFPSGVHAHYHELLALPAEIKRKMWLYHYQPGALPDAEKDGFQGFVKRGQTFDFSNSFLPSKEKV
ncbi:MAG: MBL fold metallo-hydrolase [Tildeniella nuda ZEHNDER 1965/U140]|jgi:ribonuclease BN (tRNA processing enzyme)|nr:MBL fold metallo-hydrolase [Tildeniella nuda ZEHNDER 1965/U140]